MTPRPPVKSVLAHTLDRLGEQIVTGRYAPGSSIPPEPALGESFGVSRTVVREAVKSLVAKGLLVTGPKVGTRVMPEEHWNWFDSDGRARWRDETVALSEGKPQAMLSPLMASGGVQLRHSPVGFRSDFHCTDSAQWVFILGGQMGIGLQDGSERVFHPGQHFYSADHLPAGAAFDPAVHGHWSRQLGPDPLITAFVRG